MNEVIDIQSDIPDDLTLLTPGPAELEPHQIKEINELDWYCFEGNRSGHIFVSQNKLEVILGGTIDSTSPSECASGNNFQLVQIGQSTHRWSSEDGWYWA